MTACSCPRSTRAAVLLLLAVLGVGAAQAGAEEEVASIGGLPSEARIPASRPGFCLDLGCGDGKLAAEIAQKTKYTVCAVANDDKDCDRARQALDHAGVYGARATATSASLKKLPFPNGYGNLIVSGDHQDLDLKEVLRVLNPNGVAILGGGKADTGKIKSALDAAKVKDYKVSGTYVIIKGRMPEGVDDWTHYAHGADNNRTSRETTVRPPFRTQWLSGTTQHDQAWVCNLMIAGGRAVYRTTGSHHYYAWDSFNGALLWDHQSKSASDMFRCALIDGIFYSPENDKILAIDAETGKEKATFQDSGSGEFLWTAVDNGVLYAMARGTVQMRSALGEIIYAFNLKDGKLAWKHPVKLPVEMRAMCVGGGNVFYCSLSKDGKPLPASIADDWNGGPNGDCVVGALDAKTGQEKWTATIGWSSMCLYAALNDAAGYVDGKYFVWGGAGNWGTGKSTKAFDGKTGKIVKEYPAGYSGGPNGPDLSQPLFLDGKMYCGHGASYQCMDETTGAEKGEVPKTGCGAGSASGNCLYSGGQGFSVFDLPTGKRWSLDGILRAPCYEGPSAANGLLFNMQGHCGCPYLIKEPVALAPAGSDWTPPEAAKDIAARLVAGPSIASPLAEAGKQESGNTAPKLPAGVRPTPATFGGGMGYIASREGFVWGADGKTGDIHWKFICGGGVRMAPSYFRGRVLVGSDCGEVYCLDAKTGQLCWRFRAAPEDRFINVEGELSSTWPVRTGVAVGDGIAYFGAGLHPFDGAYLYALDVKTGKPAWSKRIGDMEHQDGIPTAVLSISGDKLIIAAVERGRNPVPTAYRKSDGEMIK